MLNREAAEIFQRYAIYATGEADKLLEYPDEECDDLISAGMMLAKYLLEIGTGGEFLR